jgi:hypothetical protein
MRLFQKSVRDSGGDTDSDHHEAGRRIGVGGGKAALKPPQSKRWREVRSGPGNREAFGVRPSSAALLFWRK